MPSPYLGVCDSGVADRVILHFADYRFSEDMDFTLTGDLSFEALKAELEGMEL